MGSLSVATTVTTRLFLGVPIPDTARGALASGLAQYPQYIERTVPPERWHVTLVFLGEVEHPRQYYSRLFKALPQTFVPTIALTHVGRGLAREQLWAFVHASPGFLGLRQQLVARLKKMRLPLPPALDREFTPHVHLANLFPMARGIGLADHPLSLSFIFPAVHLYRSTVTHEGPAYTIEGTIAL